jgi:hypothetical protein
MEPFEDIDANGTYNITISQGEESQVNLFIDSNILPLIQTTVTNRRLFIGVQDGQCYNGGPVEMSIVSPDYDAIVLNGACNLTAYNINTSYLVFTLNGTSGVSSSFDVTSFNLNIEGSGNAQIAGNASEGKLQITGAGSIYGPSAIFDSCYIKVSGSGDVRISVRKFLDVNISGTGNVFYSGDPAEINSVITGTGQLIKEG